MKKTILIIDDEEEVVEYLGRQLKSKEYEPLMAYDGKQGLIMLSQHKIDAIVTDIVMEGMGGYELCKKIKEIEEYADIPIVVCTAHVQEEPPFHALGIQDYLIKPFTIDDLHLTLQRIFQRDVNTMDNKKILIQADKTSSIESAVQFLESYGFKTDIKVIQNSNEIVETCLQYHPDILIFNALDEQVYPDTLINSLTSYVDLRNLITIFYLQSQKDLPPKKKEQEELIDRCLAAGAHGYMSSLERDDILKILFQFCKVQT